MVELSSSFFDIKNKNCVGFQLFFNKGRGNEMSAEKKSKNDARNFVKAENFFGCGATDVNLKKGSGGVHSLYTDKVRHEAVSSQEMTFVETLQTL